MRTAFALSTMAVVGLAASCAAEKPPSQGAPVAAPAPVSSTTVVVTDAVPPDEPGVSGKTTSLLVKRGERSMAMDGPAPQTTWSLRESAAPYSVIKGGAWTGDYRLSGFAQTTKVYVILYFDQVGAWYGIRDIAYLDEKGALQENIGDKLAGEHLFAVTDAMSPDGQFIAFVGKASDSRPGAFRVLLFDVAQKKLRNIAAPPAAPPSELADACKGSGAQSWLDKAGIAAYQPIDENILTFTDGKLRISYGPDTCKARAKKRTIKEFPLLP